MPSTTVAVRAQMIHPSQQRQALKQFAYIFIHLKSCVEKKKNQRNRHSLFLQPIHFPSTQNILITGKIVTTACTKENQNEKPQSNRSFQ